MISLLLFSLSIFSIVVVIIIETSRNQFACISCTFLDVTVYVCVYVICALFFDMDSYERSIFDQSDQTIDEKRERNFVRLENIDR